MTNPKVSIGMPVYNGEPFIREALDSLLAQTFTDFELIISDNASTDDTEEICQNYASKDSRIRYIRQPKNLGASYNFQFVLDEAVGEYFMWAAHDDLRSQDSLEYYLSNIGDAKAFFSSYDFIDWSNNKKSLLRKIPLLSGEANNRDDICAFLNYHTCTHMIYGLFKTRELKCIVLGSKNWQIDWGDSLILITFICRFGYKTQVSDSKFSYGYFIKYKIKPNHKYLNPFPFIIKLFSISLVPFDSKKLLLSLKVAIIFSKTSLVHFVKNIFQKTSMEG